MFICFHGRFAYTVFENWAHERICRIRCHPAAVIATATSFRAWRRLDGASVGEHTRWGPDLLKVCVEKLTQTSLDVLIYDDADLRRGHNGGCKRQTGKITDKSLFSGIGLMTMQMREVLTKGADYRVETI